MRTNSSDAPSGVVVFGAGACMYPPIPERFRDASGVHWHGPRGETAARFYREADVFLFPTLSDGFGLTQLEAQAWRLPVIASRFCGDVVQDGVNGLLLARGFC